MPRGPQGQKRPADVVGNAVRVMRDRDRARPQRTHRHQALDDHWQRRPQRGAVHLAGR